ncbi:MAG: ankyrin repeat domain-containing protein [Candidatus Hydrogenedentes bacterium]|nr:ankyrin repeat domain-containing protein [Candidatus Hydrogenedentota bacterium]
MERDWLRTVDDQGLTPLARVTSCCHMALTEVLLRREAEDRSVSLSGSSTLHKAAYIGLPEAVSVILNDGSDPNARDKYGEAPLHKAARQGHEKVVALLLQNGADPNAADVFGLTPLHWTSMIGHAHITDALLENGADPDYLSEFLDYLSPADLARIMGNIQILDIFARARGVSQF